MAHSVRTATTVTLYTTTSGFGILSTFGSLKITLIWNISTRESKVKCTWKQVSTVTTIQWPNTVLFDKQVTVWFPPIYHQFTCHRLFSFIYIAAAVKARKTTAVCTLVLMMPVIALKIVALCSYQSAAHMNWILPKCTVFSVLLWWDCFVWMFEIIFCACFSNKKRIKKKVCVTVLLLYFYPFGENAAWHPS